MPHPLRRTAVAVLHTQTVPAARARVQDRDEIQDHGPDADGRENDVVDDAVAVPQEEEEGDGEDLLDDNMWKCAPHAPRKHEEFVVAKSCHLASAWPPRRASRAVPCL